MLSNILYLLGGLVVGVILGFLISRLITQKYLKKNPPIN